MKVWLKLCKLRRCVMPSVLEPV